MKHSSVLRLILISVTLSMALGAISFFALRAVNESSTGEVRRHLILLIAQAIERGPFVETVREYRPRPGRRGPGTELWVFSESGAVLATNTDLPPPIALDTLKLPAAPHDYVFHYRSFRLIPDLAVVKLEPAPPGPQDPLPPKGDAFLLIEFRRASVPGNTFWVQAAFVCFVAAVAVLIALILLSVYLKRKSKEARDVLSRLEKGDLKARFKIGRIDEIGSIMLDFNRMASEIERLVLRVEETETARKNLLEELSHDLRTPLTSLKTSIDTLHDHLESMPVEEQREFLSVCRSELSYFLRLLDDLFFIADLGEPRYKKTTRPVDLGLLIHDEITGRQTQNQNLSFSFQPPPMKAVIQGDPLLILRLIKNAIDNAAKHASKQISLELSDEKSKVTLSVEDDGPGISDEAIGFFGKRRNQRLPIQGSAHATSLGLGSVIIKTIVDLHGGTLSVARSARGTRLTVSIPK